MLCPVCKNEWEEGTAHCPICGYELNDYNEEAEWIIIGDIDDKVSADYAKETLLSSEIPVVIFSKSGFFGNVGLPLHPFYKPGTGVFEVAVPGEYQEEAVEILDIILGEQWHQKEI
ncbi:MAG: hypothetical protein ACOYVF_12530 [Candidatus Zixiibacteriota bacterium]